MIVVTGATGKLGRLVVEKLLERVSPDSVAVSVRDPSKAEDLAKRGVLIRHGDFAQPGTLTAAFAGAKQLLIISSNAGAFGGDPKSQHREAIAAAKSAGAGRILYTSHMAASARSAFLPMHTHAATEDMLRESGVAWTALRHGYYVDTARQLTTSAASSGEIAVPKDGPTAWTSHEDLAAGAAVILTQEGRFDGPTPPLTASRALDFTDVAAVLGEIMGRPIVRKTPSDAEYEQALAGRGVPGPIISITLSMFRAARAGEFSQTDPTLSALLGREPMSLAQALGSAEMSGPGS